VFRSDHGKRLSSIDSRRKETAHPLTHRFLDCLIVVFDQFAIDRIQERPSRGLALHVIQDLAKQDVITVPNRLSDTVWIESY
jgi:hypothetical protein